MLPSIGCQSANPGLGRVRGDGKNESKRERDSLVFLSFFIPFTSEEMTVDKSATQWNSPEWSLRLGLGGGGILIAYSKVRSSIGFTE